MTEHVFPRDRALTIVSMMIGVVVWASVAAVDTHIASTATVVRSLVVALVGVLASFIAYVFAKSAAIAHLRGNAIEVTEHQLPDL